MSVRLTISGDFCIMPAYLEKDLISLGIKQVFGQSDFNIVNLKCLVRIIMNGPHLQTRSEINDYLRQLNIRVVTLANNHILEYGVEGLQSTFTFQEVERLSGILVDEKKFQADWAAFIEERKSQDLLVFSGINTLPENTFDRRPSAWD